MWDPLDLSDSDKSVFKEYGTEARQELPFHKEQYPVSNHIRVLLDLISEGQFGLAQGMRNDFICTDKYDTENFNKIYMLKKSNLWSKISELMERKYLLKWLNYLESNNETNNRLILNQRKAEDPTHKKINIDFLSYITQHKDQLFLKEELVLCCVMGLDYFLRIFICKILMVIPKK